MLGTSDRLRSNRNAIRTLGPQVTGVQRQNLAVFMSGYQSGLNRDQICYQLVRNIMNMLSLTGNQRFHEVIQDY